jgi:RimJ/RimL family protein N-acetyltransferase
MTSPFARFILETDRLTLRELTFEDDTFVFELLNEPAYLQYIGDKNVRSPDDARKYLTIGPLASYAKHGYGLWRVALKDSDTAIGMCGLLKRDGMDHPDIGYALLARFHGRGYAREAATAVVAHARNVLKLDTLQAVTAQENPASIGLLEKLGFRFDRMITMDGYAEPSRLFVLKR